MPAVWSIRTRSPVIINILETGVLRVMYSAQYSQQNGDNNTLLNYNNGDSWGSNRKVEY